MSDTPVHDVGCILGDAMMGAGMYKTESIDQDGALLLLNMLIQLQQLLSPRHKDYRGANSYSLAMVAFSSRIILK